MNETTGLAIGVIFGVDGAVAVVETLVAVLLIRYHAKSPSTWLALLASGASILLATRLVSTMWTVLYQVLFMPASQLTPEQENHLMVASSFSSILGLGLQILGLAGLGLIVAGALLATRGQAPSAIARVLKQAWGNFLRWASFSS
jgi:hypothetical protein